MKQVQAILPFAPSSFPPSLPMFSCFWAIISAKSIGDLFFWEANNRPRLEWQPIFYSRVLGNGARTSYLLRRTSRLSMLTHKSTPPQSLPSSAHAAFQIRPAVTHSICPHLLKWRMILLNRLSYTPLTERNPVGTHGFSSDDGRLVYTCLVISSQSQVLWFGFAYFSHAVTSREKRNIIFPGKPDLFHRSLGLIHLRIKWQ